MFSDSEIKVLSEIKEFFKNYSSSDIKNFSHEERGYRETVKNAMISYRYAEYLQI